MNEAHEEIEGLSPRLPPVKERKPSIKSLTGSFTPEIVEGKRVSEIEEKNEEDSHDDQPLIYLDVTIGQGNQAPLIIYESDNYLEVTEYFCLLNRIEGTKKQRLFKAVTDALACVSNKSSSR